MAPELTDVERRPPSGLRDLYETFLRAALDHFFEHASIVRERRGTPPTDPPRIATTGTATEVAIDWLGCRYTLWPSPARPLSAAELRLVAAIVLALAARYRAVLNPAVMAENGDLFRGAIEDRIVGAFIDPRPYQLDAPTALADRITPALDLLRVAAVSSYENRPISTGLLLLGDDVAAQPAARSAPSYAQVLTSAKSLFRLANGVRGLFLVNAQDSVVDIIDIERWADRLSTTTVTVPSAQGYVPHARATLRAGNVCLVLSPSHEMKVFAEGAQLFTFRNATWRLLDLETRFEQWAASVGSRPLAERLFRTALDLADAREGALFVVLRDPVRAAPQLLAAGDRLDRPEAVGEPEAVVARRRLLRLLAGRTVVELDASVLGALAAIDGAVVTDASGLILAAGAIIRHPPFEDADEDGIAEGARTTAAIFASRFGPVLKVSEDGVITFFDRRKIWEI